MCSIHAAHNRCDDLQKVQLANELYKFTSVVLLLAHSLGILWSVENPLRSLFWLTKWMKAVAELPNIFRATFPNCLHGGQRPKWTLLLHCKSACKTSEDDETNGWCLSTIGRPSSLRVLVVAINATCTSCFPDLMTVFIFCPPSASWVRTTIMKT